MVYPELEIFLSRLGEAECQAVFRLQHAETSTDLRFEVESVSIDARELGTLLGDPVRYGLRLGRALFGHENARQAFTRATDLANAQQTALRVRLCTDQRSLKLHRLRWETLRVPAPGAPDDPTRARWLAAGGQFLFSRHLFSGDMRPVRLRPQSELSALVALASPTDPGTSWRGLAPIDVAEVLSTADEGLGPLKKTHLVPEGGRRVTLERLLTALRAEVDVLYLVCHGKMVDGEPRLLLEKEDGTADNVSGLKLVQAFGGLRSLPRLVVLVSCQSAGAEKVPGTDAGVLAALGPRLAEAGVPAVLAMQGNLRMDTARRFFPPFFASLQKTGRVDEAATAARAEIQDAPDAWVPVLYTRLAEGRVWFTRGLTMKDGSDGFKAWQQLAIQIDQGRCVPILGSGVLEPFVGTTREVANRLAVQSGYPLALSAGEELPQVAQFIDTTRLAASPPVHVPVLTAMAAAVAERHPGLALGPVSPLHPNKDLQQGLNAAWAAYQENRPHEPHRYLAGMKKIRTFITTNPDDLLKTALEEAGRPPQVHVCRWDGDPQDDQPPTNPSFDALADRPEVFQLMGHLDDPESLVLTEDDYFRFLTAVTRRESRKKDAHRDDDFIDDKLRKALASSALLFLGFRITDWDFRTLCRLLIDQKGGNKRRGRSHIAVQIDPEDGTHGNPRAAREFVEKLFEGLLGHGQVAVYWGGIEDFLEDLDKQWQQMQTP
jgi:hypothetical protein